jgi:predicted GIY-YIG superfamily endonuclease
MRVTGQAGTVYLLHFERPYQHARHYLGWSADLEARLAEHRAARGSPLIRAAAASGIGFLVARTWPGDRRAERRLHRVKNSPARLCPICRRMAAASSQELTSE